jgi:L-alanine-DL-glutamate epimerase-like enolase superfamily enzyme
VRRVPERSARLRSMIAYRVNLPLSEPLCHAGISTRSLQEVFLTVTDTSGTVGFSEVRGNGEYATGQTGETIVADLQRAAACLRDCSLDDVPQILIDATGNRLAAALAEGAALDALAKRAGLPLCRYLGRPRATAIPTHGSIGFVDHERAAKLAEAMFGTGVRRIKVRVGSEAIDSDIARVGAVRAAVGSACAIAVDANGAWTADVAVNAISRLSAFEVAWVEQPTKPADYDAMQTVRRRTGVPIVADEAVKTHEDVVRLVQIHACDGVHLKLEKCGSTEELWRAVRVARDARVLVEIGLMDQGRLGSARVAHVAAVTDADVFELWGFERVAEDISSGFEVSGGLAVLPRGPGVGVEVDLTGAESLTIL